MIHEWGSCRHKLCSGRRPAPRWPRFLQNWKPLQSSESVLWHVSSRHIGTSLSPLSGETKATGRGVRRGRRKVAGGEGRPSIGFSLSARVHLLPRRSLGFSFFFCWPPENILFLAQATAFMSVSKKRVNFGPVNKEL
jgi:hypothetical protein